MTLLRAALALVLMLMSLPSLAVNYVFPTLMPAGCSGSGASYTCGSVSLGYNDTISIASGTPTTIRINGNLSTNNARINASGSAANLTLQVTGTLSTGYEARVNANVTAGVIHDGGGGQVIFGGSLATTTGAITLGYGSRVTGDLTSTTGAIAIGGIVEVGGQVSCSCAVTLAYNARVVGNIHAASVSASGQVFLQGAVTTSGNFEVGYGSTLAGAVTAGGSLRLNGNIQAPQCLRSTSASVITLAWADRANGGVCCGAPGSCSTSCVVNNSGAAMPALCSGGTPPPAAPSRFNAVDTGTAAGQITGDIRTKIAGTAFTLAIVAVNPAGNGVHTSFTGSVRVELLDGSNNSGAMNGSTNCRSSWGAAAGVSAVTLSFEASDLGRKNVTLTVPEAFRDARIRVTHPDSGSATATGCSTDHFAVRPARFDTIQAWDADWATPGDTRRLDTTSATGGRVHKAGRPFTLRAVARSSTGAATTGYSGSATATAVACSGGACGTTLGTLSATLAAVGTTGQLVSTTATYSEAGVVNVRLTDTSYANVDEDDTPLADRTISSDPVAAPALIGRFVPDHFALVPVIEPVLRTFGDSSCTTRSFTYYGQPFGYTVRPQARVEARNAAGGITRNYAQWAGIVIDTPAYAVDTTVAGVALVSNAGATPSAMPTLLAQTGTNAGTALMTGSADERLTMVRPSGGPLAPLDDARISLRWIVADRTDDAPAQGAITVLDPSAPTYNGSPPVAPGLAFDGMGAAPRRFRYGTLHLPNAYGSELVALPVLAEIRAWNGSSFVTHTDDSCTTLPTGAIAMGHYRQNLAACETAPTGTSLAFASGRAVLRLRAPGAGNTGSLDLQVNLGATATGQHCAGVGSAPIAATTAAQPWLQARGSGASHDQNPAARISFGQHRSPLIQLREVY